MAKFNKKLHDDLASKGRYGDTIVAHISKAQSRYLLKGHRPTINPDTGLPEHFWGALAGAVAGPIVGKILGGGTSKQAKAAQQAETENLKFQQEMARRQADIGDKAGGALTDAYKGLMDDPEFGTFGRFTRSGYNDARDGWMNSISGARSAGATGRSDNLTGMGAATGGRISGYEKSLAGLQHDQNSDWLNDPRNFMAGRFAGAGTDDNYAQSRDLSGYGNLRASSFQGSAGYDPSSWDSYLSGATGEYYNLLNDQTDQALADALQDANAEAEARGLGNSTYEIGLRQAIGAESSNARAANMQRALDMAMNMAKGRQGLAVGDYEVGRSMDTDAFGRIIESGKLAQGSQSLDLESYLGTGRLNNDAVGLDQRAADLMRGNRSAEIQNMLRLLEGGQSLRFGEQDQYFKDRAMAFDDWYKGQTMVPDDYTAAMRSAFDYFTGMGAQRTRLIDEVTGLTVDPYAIQSGYFQRAGQQGAYASQGYGNQASRLNTNAVNAAQGYGSAFQNFWEKSGAGDWIDDLFSGGYTPSDAGGGGYFDGLDI